MPVKQIVREEAILETSSVRREELLACKENFYFQDSIEQVALDLELGIVLEFRMVVRAV
jgi:hypothetical protein